MDGKYSSGFTVGWICWCQGLAVGFSKGYTWIFGCADVGIPTPALFKVNCIICVRCCGRYPDCPVLRCSQITVLWDRDMRWDMTEFADSCEMHSNPTGSTGTGNSLLIKESCCYEHLLPTPKCYDCALMIRFSFFDHLCFVPWIYLISQVWKVNCLSTKLYLDIKSNKFSLF